MRYDWLSFSREEVAVLMLVFFTPIALLPAAFLQVAQHHRFTAAFNLIAAVRLVRPRLVLMASDIRAIRANFREIKSLA